MLCRPHLKRRALSDRRDETRREAVVVPGRLANDRTHGRHVVVIERASDGIGQQLLGQGRQEPVRSRQQRRLEAGGPSNCVPSGSTADASIGCGGLAARPPLADGVEVLERETERIHHRMTARADRVGAMLRQPLAHREHRAAAVGRLRSPTLGAAVAAACPAGFRESICRAPPARCDRDTRSPSECCRGPASRRARCPSPSVTRLNGCP